MDVRFAGESAGHIAVEGGITTDTAAHWIMLSMSGDFFEKKPKVMVTNASITITDNDNNVFQLTETQPGVYRTDSDVYGIIGNTYTMNINLGDTASYQATETIRALPDIDSIRFEKTTGFDMDAGLTHGYNLLYYGTEPAGKGDYYFWSLYINNDQYTDSLYKNVFTSDDFVDGNYIKNLDLFFIPEDDLPADTMYVRLEMFSISEEYYDYIVGLMLETVWKGSPWDGPPANAVGNVNNDAYGFFTAEDKKTISRLLIKE